MFAWLGIRAGEDRKAKHVYKVREKQEIDVRSISGTIQEASKETAATVTIQGQATSAHTEKNEERRSKTPERPNEPSNTYIAHQSSHKTAPIQSESMYSCHVWRSSTPVEPFFPVQPTDVVSRMCMGMRDMMHLHLCIRRSHSNWWGGGRHSRRIGSYRLSAATMC